ncbi:hypothetical protein PGT21_019804 [Puccinia graminis f. sp. tritici]|uniref:Uncharacterized protein n=1 Tax=Puccinia graminis f. sp. tritici TaxID=56615 RepID=A0A5B0P5Z9_PUCGR|nr:hypothetical protein PGT21_019804 [Puccinia graminis f. sp. tritici]KAA1131894.1 hypothetical protein PGTUg99_032797 [Puccinia graminis f. sp. tritici]
MEKLRLMDKFAYAESQLVSNTSKILNYAIKKFDVKLKSYQLYSKAVGEDESPEYFSPASLVLDFGFNKSENPNFNFLFEQVFPSESDHIKIGSSQEILGDSMDKKRKNIIEVDDSFPKDKKGKCGQPINIKY